MKLYTEEQLHKLIIRYRQNLTEFSLEKPTTQHLIDELVPVELPTKEISYQRIMKAASDWVEQNGDKWSNNNNEVGDNYGSFIEGANWMREQLTK